VSQVVSFMCQVMLHKVSAYADLCTHAKGTAIHLPFCWYVNTARHAPEQRRCGHPFA